MVWAISHINLVCGQGGGLFFTSTLSSMDGGCSVRAVTSSEKHTAEGRLGLHLCSTVLHCELRKFYSIITLFTKLMKLLCYQVNTINLFIRNQTNYYGRLFLAPAECCSLLVQWWGPSGPVLCFSGAKKKFWRNFFSAIIRFKVHKKK